MGQIAAIWKWRFAWPFRSESRVIDQLANDVAPFAITRFDARAFADELSKRFGSGYDAAFNIEVCDFTGHRGNWIWITDYGSATDEILNELVSMCSAKGLHIYSG